MSNPKNAFFGYFFFCFWKFHFLFLSNKTLLNMFLTLIFFPNLLKTVIFSVQPIILKTIKNLKNWKFVAEKSKFSERKNLKIKSLKIFDYAWDIRRREKLKTTIQNGRFSCFLAPIENRFFFLSYPFFRPIHLVFFSIFSGKITGKKTFFGHPKSECPQYQLRNSREGPRF